MRMRALSATLLTVLSTAAAGCDARAVPGREQEWDEAIADADQQLKDAYPDLFAQAADVGGIEDPLSAQLQRRSCGGGDLSGRFTDLQPTISANLGRAKEQADDAATEFRALLADDGWMIEEVARDTVVVATRGDLALRLEFGPGATPTSLEGPCIETSGSYAEEHHGIVETLEGAPPDE